MVSNLCLTLLSRVSTIPPEIYNHTSFLFYIKTVERKIYEHCNNRIYAMTASPGCTPDLIPALMIIILPSY